MSGIDMSAKVAPLASTTYFDKKRASSLVLHTSKSKIQALLRAFIIHKNSERGKKHGKN